MNKRKPGPPRTATSSRDPLNRPWKCPHEYHYMYNNHLTHQDDVTEDTEDGSGGWVLLAPPEVEVAVPLDHDVLPVRPLLSPSSHRSFTMTIQVISQHYPWLTHPAYSPPSPVWWDHELHEDTDALAIGDRWSRRWRGCHSWGSPCPPHCGCTSYDVTGHNNHEFCKMQRLWTFWQWRCFDYYGYWRLWQPSLTPPHWPSSYFGLKCIIVKKWPYTRKWIIDRIIQHFILMNMKLFNKFSSKS